MTPSLGFIEAGGSDQHHGSISLNVNAANLL